jgi:hypothetical protein
MKNLFLTASVVALCLFCSCGQDAKSKSEQSKTKELLSASGKLLHQELYLVDKILASNYTVRVEAIIINDVNGGGKTGALQISTYSTVGPKLTTHRNLLDYDEIEQVINTLEHIKSNVVNTAPEISSKVEFLSKSGLKAGAYYEPDQQKLWTVFFNTEGDEPTARGSVPLDHLDEAISVFRQALQFVNDKIL